jgi:hypothetical protein
MLQVFIVYEGTEILLCELCAPIVLPLQTEGALEHVLIIRFTASTGE